jgi:hypothetical protein
MSERTKDIFVALTMVVVGSTGLLSGVLDHPVGMTLAFVVLVVLIPGFVEALRRATPSPETKAKPHAVAQVVCGYCIRASHHVRDRRGEVSAS